MRARARARALVLTTDYYCMCMCMHTYYVYGRRARSAAPYSLLTTTYLLHAYLLLTWKTGQKRCLNWSPNFWRTSRKVYCFTWSGLGLGVRVRVKGEGEGER